MIELRGISKTYRTGKVPFQALKDVSLKIEQGEFIAIMGPSGSGKSTLLHLLGFLDRPDSGSYRIFDQEVSSLDDNQLAHLRNHLAGFVFQQFHLLPRLTAFENVRMPLMYAGKRHLTEPPQERLREVGLEARTKNRPNEMSGGEQQRTAIARALVNDPVLIFADEPTGNLDTKSEEEIVAILKRLNAQGKTIVIVTHEREIAEHARRVICMRDGQIISDERKQPAVSGKASASSGMSLEALISSGSTQKPGLMDHTRQAFQAMLAHQVRSFLSVLGILIGVAAVIAMLALGEGAKASIAQRLASLGSNLLAVHPGSSRVRGVALEAGSVTRFTLNDAEAMAKLPSVKRASASVTGRGQLVYGSKNWNSRIEGVGIAYESMRSAKPIQGRFFTEEELRQRSKTALVGMTVVQELFDGENPVGKIMKINRTNFRVIGVLPEKGSTMWRDQDDTVVIPLTTAMYRLLGKNYVDSIDAEAQGPALMEQAKEEIRELIIKRHRLAKEAEDNFDIRNMVELQETLASTTKTMTWLLGAIAVISLLVGGIGIMNIMLVSVTERTREIGLRKALGARAEDILLQFLIEAVVLTLSGGVIGIALGIGSAALLSLFAGWATKVSWVAVMVAAVFSMGVGLFFGMFPARKAAKLNPIEALRYE